MADEILTERAQAWAQKMEDNYGLEAVYTSPVVIAFFAAVAAVVVVWLVAVFMNRKNRMANSAIAAYSTAAVAALLLVVDNSAVIALMLFATFTVAMLLVGPKAVEADQKSADGR